MKTITHPRDTDDLSPFGSVLRFAALIYESEEEGEGNSPFAPHGIDGDAVFLPDRETADALFEAWAVSLQAAEDQFLDEGDEEGFVALMDTPRGLMIIAGSTISGYPEPDIDAFAPGAVRLIGAPHLNWELISSEAS